MLGKICAAIPVKNINYAREEGVRAIDAGAELIEWRHDLNEENPYNPYPHPYLRFEKIETISTCMTVDEGGKFSGSNEKLAEILNVAINNGAKYITVGLDFAKRSLGSAVVNDAQQEGAKVIISLHGQKMPSFEEIIKILGEEVDAGADIAKVAFRAENFDDVKNMMLASRYNLGIPKIAIAMGEPGKMWRVLSLPECYLNYFSVGEPTAPGQMSIEEGKFYRDILFSRINKEIKRSFLQTP